jgi:5-methylcytosine-specific restriction enzyme A
MTRWTTVCLVAGCPATATHGGRCPEHQLRRPGARAWRTTRRRVLARDGYRCRLCGRPAVEVDHVMPVARGGPSDEANLRALCQRCNRAKGSR